MAATQERVILRSSGSHFESLSPQKRHQDPNLMKKHSHYAILAALVLAVSACTDGKITSSHSARAAAVSDIEHGWIPSVLPKSATDINETHDVYTNVGHGTFVFESIDADSFKAALVSLPPDQEIDGKPTRLDLEKNGYLFYSWEHFVVAVNWQKHQGEFWLGPL